MCGRYMITTPLEAIRQAFGVDERPNLRARYNVAPTDEVPIVRRAREGGRRELVIARWGLVPWWAKDASGAARMINARAESIDTKPAFRDSFREHRCLVVADGFYEWQKLAGGTKQPFMIRLRGGAPFGFAGLWSSWKDPEGRRLPTTTIVTTDANDLVRPIHDRMPVILDPADFEAWLDPATLAPAALLVPFDPDRMEAIAVSSRVNSVRNDDAAVIEPLKPAQPSLF
jgi:putative SOS response-associated peptidase YedK